jgi:N-acetylmuramoyl-L-alanine amidase
MEVIPNTSPRAKLAYAKIALGLLLALSPARAAEIPLAQPALGQQLPPLQPARRPFRVVIDAGHGGSDFGTVYSNGKLKVAEKDVTLALAKRVAHELRAVGMTVYLTRDDDSEISLPSRTALANRVKADAFLSIHMNSTEGKRVSSAAEGIETYILNNASDASSRRLAQLENSVLGNAYDTSTPEAMDVALILKDLRLDANLSESKRLACSIQQGLVSTAPAEPVRRPHPRNRGIKQALFHVLLGADMPSVLVEAGFLSSLRDRTAVLSQRGQLTMSHAIAHAVERFRRSKDQADVALSLARCRVN